ncbi:MAG: hypothetical protein HQM01_11315 [Magnetococcales bacterium]|nr:hypothetical protein [Magnetococcales bacterium]
MNTKPPSQPSVHWLDRVSWPVLLLLAAWLAVAPITPEPHLTEKLRMLLAGELSRPIDIFDLFLHASPIVVVILKARRHFAASGSG